jgi:hypothetical protein
MDMGTRGRTSRRRLRRMGGRIGEGRAGLFRAGVVWFVGYVFCGEVWMSYDGMRYDVLFSFLGYPFRILFLGVLAWLWLLYQHSWGKRMGGVGDWGSG